MMTDPHGAVKVGARLWSQEPQLLVEARDPREPAGPSDVNVPPEALGVSQREAWGRLAHAAAIDAVAADPELSRRIVLRGSTSLWLRYDLPRTPGDVDLLTLAFPGGADAEAVATEREVVQRAVARGLARRFRPWHKWRDPLVKAVKIEVSPVYMRVPCSPVRLPLPPWRQLPAAHLDYLVAEKVFAALRAVRLDESPDQRYLARRAKDLWDLHWITTNRGDLLDLRRIGELCAGGDAFQPLLAGPPSPRLLTPKIRAAFAESYEPRLGRHAATFAFDEVWRSFGDLLTRVECA